MQEQEGAALIRFGEGGYEGFWLFERKEEEDEDEAEENVKFFWR